MSFTADIFNTCYKYTIKKQKLILAKKNLEEKISAFGRKRNNRFELAINFIKDANQTEIIALQENPEQGRDFLKKIGSNFRIADRTLFLDFISAFKIAEKTMPRRFAPRQYPSISLNVKLGGEAGIRTLEPIAQLTH